MNIDLGCNYRHRMKALLLAAGLGTRLRPLTLQTPKCLLPVGGKPLLAYHLEALQHIGITDVLINTHYLHEQVDVFVGRYQEVHPDMRVTTVYEPELLGSAGTLRQNAAYFADQEHILVVYADNFTDIDYRAFIVQHTRAGTIGTIAGYYEEHPEQKGIMVFTDDHRITAFKEKPKPEEVVSHYANAGMYILHRQIFDVLGCLSVAGVLDFGHDVFPALLQQKQTLSVYLMTEHLLDIGTPENYALAQVLVDKMKKNR